MTQREIKFRCWNAILLEMYVPDFPQKANINDFFKSLKPPIMQFTGLKDRNGKEIYEGDVLKHRDLDKAGDIEKFGLVITVRNAEVVKWEYCGFYPLAGWIDTANDDLKWEIIGNIYENPELTNSVI